ncbi:undecaprenyl pyrophosphate synthase, partial [Haematococcus lacustris]
MFIGDRAALPVALTAAMARAEQATAANTRIVLTVAVNYSGQADMAAAAAAIAGLAAEGRIKPQQVDAQLLESHLATAPVTALVGCPDLLIRTSGEQRLSNFLLFELAYAELVFCKEMFPDFDEAALRRCLREFSGRQRSSSMHQVKTGDLWPGAPGVKHKAGGT